MANEYPPPEEYVRQVQRTRRWQIIGGAVFIAIIVGVIVWKLAVILITAGFLDIL